MNQLISRLPKLWRYPAAKLYQYIHFAVRTQPPAQLLLGAIIAPGTLLVTAWVISWLSPLLPWLCALISISYLVMAAIAFFTQSNYSPKQ